MSNAAITELQQQEPISHSFAFLLALSLSLRVSDLSLSRARFPVVSFYDHPFLFPASLSNPPPPFLDL